jgi:catalase
MPFEEAKTYRFNPFDLTTVCPHGDYPLHEVGRLTLNRNVTDYHIEQAAFEPNIQVPGTALSPDKMRLARGFSYAAAHRARLGVSATSSAGRRYRPGGFGPPAALPATRSPARSNYSAPRSPSP